MSHQITHHPDQILWLARQYAPKRKLSIKTVPSQLSLRLITENDKPIACFDCYETTSTAQIIDRINQKRKQ